MILITNQGLPPGLKLKPKTGVLLPPVIIASPEPPIQETDLTEYFFSQALLNSNVRHKKVNIMGHYCRICGSTKPNEKFSGKGHRNHVCKECAKMPKEERDAIEQEVEIFGFLSQSNISKKNISRLNILASSPNEHISNLADIVIEVAKVKPHKKRRLKVLERERRDLLHKLRETGLIYAHHL
ncbi:MAG: hypothetical protein V3S16_02000 [Candidatus Desulfatibia sp.]|uniref:hypothetical protein n=1 Tax=Candidatus Desulfatibia sp. TaxID=3101189 RepID=UPI002F347CC0